MGHHEELGRRSPNTHLERLGQPINITDVVVFLASEEARWVNGQTIQLNGGIL
ncbi:MAG: SDR family oxidoreductase [Leptolyngbyaceae cyanobacterium RU_5_1]|nr:SDR family oxidoreductase [Leptolyngbyaceae cyanobacterium RU_5_1]